MNYSQNNLLVFSTKRAIRAFCEDFDGLLPHMMELGEFFTRCALVSNLKKASQTQRIICLKKAVADTKNAMLVIGNVRDDFFVFLKSSEYIFKLFAELTSEKKTISNLRLSDTYAEYDEHLNILENLFSNYLSNLEKDRLYDDISLPLNYELNTGFISEFDKITLEINGILRSFEWDILCEAAKIKPVILRFWASKFNQKLIKQISEFSKLELQNGFKYELNLSSREILNQTPLNDPRVPRFAKFTLRSAQIGFIFDEISRMVRGEYAKPIEPKNIAVILPDENFGEVIKNADFKNMLNFARGKSFTNESSFRLLNTLKTAAISGFKFKKNLKKNLFSSLAIALEKYGVTDEKYASFLAKFSSYEFNFSEQILDLVRSAKPSQEALECIKNTLFDIENLLLKLKDSNEALKFSEALEVFLNELKTAKIDDKSGGEVTMTGLLESRSSNFEGVIIVDFNEDQVPRRSIKEMFLSSKVRANAGLTSHSDHENLQRFWYFSLLCNAKAVAISCVENEESAPSRFLKDFKVVEVKTHQNAYLSALLTTYAKKIDLSTPKIIAKHDFFETPLSFSRLECFLKCEKKYYYKYIMKAGEEPIIDGEDTSAWGSALHAALAQWFKNNPAKFDVHAFASSFDYPADLLRKEIFTYDLIKFESAMNTHFSSGWHVESCETKYENKFEGIKIEGRIDRIDKRQNGELMLIDYKSGSLDTKSLQLPFYQALVGLECKVAYFDFKDKQEFIYPHKEANLENLSSIINELKMRFNSEKIEFRAAFEMSGENGKTNHKSCQYCDYKIFCKKELK